LQGPNCNATLTDVLCNSKARLMQQTLKHEITRMTKRVIWGVVC
jgi:hypothetical protein